MNGEDRREGIIEELQQSKKPLSGLKLAKQFGVSRQVIVQDIAVLRAQGYDILATARGYILQQEGCVSMTVLVKHTRDQLEDELNTVIDNGGQVRNVSIIHPIYGELTGSLMLRSRKDIQGFLGKLMSEEVPTLSTLTEGVHMHTIEAMNIEDLKHIKELLKQKGYLLE